MLGSLGRISDSILFVVDWTDFYFPMSGPLGSIVLDKKWRLELCRIIRLWCWIPYLLNGGLLLFALRMLGWSIRSSVRILRVGGRRPRGKGGKGLSECLG